jgi:hypothetical protein
MITSRQVRLAALALIIGLSLTAQRAWGDDAPTPRDRLIAAITRWADLIEGATPQADTLTAHIALTRSAGLTDGIANAGADIAFQSPDRLRIAATAGDFKITGGRDRQTIWVDEISKKFAVLGKPGVPLFQAEPNRLDTTRVGPFVMPVSRLKLMMLQYMLDVTSAPAQTIDGVRCDVLAIKLLPAAEQIVGATSGHGKLWIRQTDGLPARVTYADDDKVDIQIYATQITRAVNFTPPVVRMCRRPPSAT